MGVFRSFIAIDVPLWVKTEISGIQNRLRVLDLDASWVRQENMHLTLKFLGDIDARLVPAIIKEMGAVLSPAPKFSVSLGRLGAFPDLKKPRVAWIAVEDPSDVLERLWRETEDAMWALKFPRDKRKFSPHLTVARIKSQKGNRLLAATLSAAPQTGFKPFDIASVKLYKSELTAKGSIYTELADVNLDG